MEKTEELLRKLRGHLAYKKQVKPYVIFKDAELVDILKVEPRTLDELATIKGFPRQGARVTKWGQSIVDIFNKTDEVEDFEITVDKDGDLVVNTVVKMMEMF